MRTLVEGPIPWAELAGRAEALFQDFSQFLASPEGISIGAGLGAAGLTALVTNYLQQREANVFPVLFASKRGLETENDATDFYAAVNDLTMAVTEGWNRARKERDYRSFIDTTKTASAHSVSRLVGDVRRHGSALLARLEEYGQLAEASGAAAAAFDASWDYDYDDVHRTEVYTDFETDSKGNSHPVVRTRQVYDHTEHEWTFDSEKAEMARGLLEQLLQRFSAELYDPGLAALHVEANFSDREAIQLTIDEKPGEISDDTVARYANQWLQQARLRPLPGDIKGTLTELVERSPAAFEVISHSEQRYTETTYSPGPTSGPAGYQESCALSQHCGGMAGLIGDTLSSIEKSRELAEQLWKQQNAPEKPGRVARACLDLAVESYLAAFPDSEIHLDQRVSHGLTAGVALGVGLAAGLLAYLALQQ